MKSMLNRVKHKAKL